LIDYFISLLGNPKCFSGDDYVSMANGQTKVLRDLRPGDHVLAMNSEQKIVEDEVIMMLDSQPNRPGFFFLINTLSDFVFV
jgi:hypothetical protein